MTFSYFIWPACLYCKPDDNSKNWVLSAWNYNLNTLLKTSVEEITLNDCRDLYTPLGKTFKKDITRSKLCAINSNSNKNLCTESDAAPLQILNENTYYVGGIVSFALGCGSTFPQIFTRIESHLDWIEGIVWPDESSLKMSEPMLKNEFPKDSGYDDPVE